jgi:hypothetical protein
MVRSTCPLEVGVAGRSTTGFTASWPSSAATSRCNRAVPPCREATIEVSLSNTSFSGTPPSRASAPSSPARNAGTSLASVNVTACAAEAGKLTTSPSASRKLPRPTSTLMPVCHQSTCPISPGR